MSAVVAKSDEVDDTIQRLDERLQGLVEVDWPRVVDDMGHRLADLRSQDVSATH